MSGLGKKLADLDSGGVMASLRQRQEEQEAKNAEECSEAIERDLALEDYYRRHPTFGSIVKSMRNSWPLANPQKLMQAARRMNDARPKPGASQAPPVDDETPESTE